MKVLSQGSVRAGLVGHPWAVLQKGPVLRVSMGHPRCRVRLTTVVDIVIVCCVQALEVACLLPAAQGPLQKFVASAERQAHNLIHALTPKAEVRTCTAVAAPLRMASSGTVITVNRAVLCQRARICVMSCKAVLRSVQQASPVPARACAAANAPRLLPMQRDLALVPTIISFRAAAAPDAAGAQGNRADVFPIVLPLTAAADPPCYC
jgi:hypothetical protein